MAQRTPVHAGACGTDPFRLMPVFLHQLEAMHDAAKAVSPDIIVLCHGGPIAEPDDAAHVLERTNGAPSMERLPTEVATTETMQRFKAIGLPA